MRYRAVVGVSVLLLIAGALAVGASFGGDSGGAHLDDPSFTEVSSDVGLAYTTTGNAGGSDDGAVFVADYDGDGWQDVLAIGGDEPVLFENDEGSFSRSGALPDLPYDEDTILKSALFFDHDNDGWEDLVLLPVDDRMVFLENTGGQFEIEEAGLSRHVAWATGAAAADYDGDGCLDLYVIQSGDWTETVPNRSQVDATDPGIRDNGHRNLLFRGTCGRDGFERVNATPTTRRHWSLATSFLDLTGDGRPDIHVANDFFSDVLYVNQGDGRFEARRIPETNRHGMASEVGDVNGDGRPDVFVTNIRFRDTEDIWGFNNALKMRNRGNELLVNRGNGTFENRAKEYGVAVGHWGWAAGLVDLDNDGDLDLIHTTKNTLRVNSKGVITGAGSEPPALWVRANASTFERVDGAEAGLDASNGRGMATFDFDRDGDADVLVADTSGEFDLYANEHGSDAASIKVALRTSGERAVIGSTVTVSAGGRTRVVPYNSRSDFFSQDSRVVHVGLGGAETVESITVRWPNGDETKIEDVLADRTVVVYRNGTTDTRPFAGGA